MRKTDGNWWPSELNAGQPQSLFSPKNTSLVVRDASYYKPDVASVFNVSLIYVKDEAL